MLYEMVLEQPIAKVTRVVKKNTKKWKPYPLTTVELQKSGSRLLRMSAKQILDTADALYQRGILSYPRTETDQFDDRFDFASYIQKQTASPEWGAFATQLADSGFSKPRKGKKNDKAHPPIHPTAYAGNLVGNEKKVYEYVTRRFLASCSQDAEGFQTTIIVSVNSEEFSAKGLLVLERNYLEVFPYDKWTSHELPPFEEGEEFMPTICELKEGQTTKPALLTEADLVALMDKNGIGTDATIAQHINTIVEREYVMERLEGKTKYLVPSTLGVGLVHGYSQIGLEKSLSKPQLRRETERSMVQVCDRIKSKNDMLQESIDQYKEVFILVRREFDQVVESVRHYIQGPGQPQGNAGNNGGRREGRANQRPRGGAQNGRGFPPDSDDDFDDGPPPAAPPAARVRTNSSRSAHNQPGSSSAPQSDGMNCHCDVPAIQRTSGTEATKGRKFWRCGGGPGKDCEFFQWVDTPPSRPPTTAAKVPKEPGSRAAITGTKRKPSDDNEDARQCRCKKDAIERTVTKEGQNKGRTFWKCSNPEDSQCKFFEWGDEPPGGSKLSAAVFGESTRQNSATTGECYKCHQPGHWSSDPSDSLKKLVRTACKARMQVVVAPRVRILVTSAIRPATGRIIVQTRDLLRVVQFLIRDCVGQPASMMMILLAPVLDGQEHAINADNQVISRTIVPMMHLLPVAGEEDEEEEEEDPSQGRRAEGEGDRREEARERGDRPFLQQIGKKSIFSMPSGRTPQISTTLGIAMMVCGLIGWIYYPKIADYEVEKRKSLKERQQGDASSSTPNA
ncbi:DNA topoisomerase [Serendipita sp. 399]|nr:DNA topoisomerase [Serendipita sp. 399]